MHVVADAAVSALLSAYCCRPAPSDDCELTFSPASRAPSSSRVGLSGLSGKTDASRLDTNQNRQVAAKLRQAAEGEGDRLADLRLRRLGPSHPDAIVLVERSSVAGLMTTASACSDSS